MPSKTKKATTSFEESIQELEEIVTSMEEEQLPLEELISHYERGAQLHKQCEVFLNSAKQRLETIAHQNTEDELKSDPTPSKSKDATSTPNKNLDDEIRLF
mgnify:CR=1 FL=1